MISSENYRAKEHYRSAGVAESYDDERFSTWYGRLAHRIESAALAQAARKYFSGSGRVLDIPCGTGRLFPVLLEAGLKVTGGDISDAMLAVAVKKFSGNPDVQFQKIDAEKMAFPDNTFDYVTSYRLMCHLPPAVRSRVLDEMVRVCRKIAVVNYHVAVPTPLYFFNRVFRPHTAITHPLKAADLKRELAARSDIEVLDMRPLSWFEQSSLLVVIKKRNG